MTGTLLAAVGAATTATIGPAHGCTLYSVTVTAAGATATVTVRENGASGTVLYAASVVANTSHQGRFGGVVVSGQCHVTTSGAGGGAYIEYA
jgi:hypothetical protein